MVVGIVVVVVVVVTYSLISVVQPFFISGTTFLYHRYMWWRGVTLVASP